MVNNIKLACFPILVRDENKRIVDRGTGFFINKEGNFLSAGHVFKHEKCTFSAIINNHSDEQFVTEVDKEYIPQDEVTSSIYKDLYVGKIYTSPISCLSLSRNIESIGSEVLMTGYNKIPPENLISSIDDLFDDDLINEDSIFFNVYKTKINDERHHKTNRTTGNFYFMDNIYSVDNVGSRVRGISGGALVNNNGTCIGIVNNPYECVNSDYITKKLDSLKIPFKTI